MSSYANGKFVGQSLFEGKVVLELGSGPGLGAFIAANWAKEVVLTDHMDLVLDLIASNIEKCNPRPADCKMLLAKLDWTLMNLGGGDGLWTIDVENSDRNKVDSMADKTFDVMIGTDVVYWPAML